jgi:hypothetical protein
MFILLLTGYWVKCSEKNYIYNVLHLVAIIHEIQNVSFDALKKRMMAIGHLHITTTLNVIPHLSMCELLRANESNGNVIAKFFVTKPHKFYLYVSITRRYNQLLSCSNTFFCFFRNRRRYVCGTGVYFSDSWLQDLC